MKNMKVNAVSLICFLVIVISPVDVFSLPMSNKKLTCECSCKAQDGTTEKQTVDYPSGGCSVVKGAYCDVNGKGGKIIACEKVVKNAMFKVQGVESDDERWRVNPNP